MVNNLSIRQQQTNEKHVSANQGIFFLKSLPFIVKYWIVSPIPDIKQVTLNYLFNQLNNVKSEHHP